MIPFDILGLSLSHARAIWRYLGSCQNTVTADHEDSAEEPLLKAVMLFFHYYRVEAGPKLYVYTCNQPSILNRPAIKSSILRHCMATIIPQGRVHAILWLTDVTEGSNTQHVKMSMFETGLL